ncbi:MAG: hypothetical protein QM785_17525 [Pyrinomonadaceae bacterium]
MKILLFFVMIAGLVFSANAQPKKAASKAGPVDETTFFATIEHNGEKTEIKYSQFITHGGTTIPDGSSPGRMLLTYGASNNKDDKSFSFQGQIPASAKGSYPIGSGAAFNLMTTAFPNVPMFMASSGSYEIGATPLKGGFVDGTFSVVCKNVDKDGNEDVYNISGSFHLLRQ